MPATRARNWIFTLGFTVAALAVSALGVFGWAYAAGAWQARSWGDLDPLWPFYVVAVVGCVAAQVVAACSVVNFARLALAPRVWRALALAFYAVSVTFAAYSADHGAQVILGVAHRAAYESREKERAALAKEITTLSATIKKERDKIPVAGSVGPKTLDAATATFEATTAVEQSRLPVAQTELRSKPPLGRDTPPAKWDNAVFIAFLVWGALEPWGFALAERGRQVAPVPHSATNGVRVLRNREPGLIRRFAAWCGLLTLATGATTEPALAATHNPEPVANPDPITLKAEMDEKAVAFSMRGRFSVDDIAKRVNRDRSTVYRWFAKRDAQAA